MNRHGLMKLATAGCLLATTAPGIARASEIVREEKTIVLTGSRIPHVIRRVGRITYGASPVTVIDRAQIERSGASTVVDVLRMDPAVRIRTGP